MDLRGGPPFKQQQDFGIQDLWAPTTPEKIIPTRTFVPNPGYIQRNQPSGSSWIDQVLAVSDGVQTATSPWGLAFPNGIYSSTGHGVCLRDLSGSLAVAHPSAREATIGSSFMPQATNTSYDNAGSMNCWSPELSGKVIAAGNETRICQLIPSTPLYAQDGRYQELPSSPTQLLLNGNILLPGDFGSSSSKSNWPGQKDQYGSTMTFLPKQNLFPETMMSFAGTVSMPNFQTPTINEKYSKRMDDKQPYLDVIDLVGEDKRKENLLRKEASLLQISFDKPAETPFSNLIASSQYTYLQNPQCINDMLFLSDKLADQHAGVELSPTEIENQGTALIDASTQETKRKKHRPKVIIEGIPARTPKPATPKLKTPKPAGGTENASGKRKYTRRKKGKSPSSEVNTLGEIADAESQSGAKSVRRCLNFDLEESRTIDSHSVLTSLFTQDLENHVQNVCENGTSTNSRLIKKMDSAGAQGPVVENSLTGINFDLNSSKRQPKNEHMKVLQTPAPSVIVSQKLGATENIVSSNIISNAPPKGTKRVHCLIDEAWVLNNLMHSYNAGDSASKRLEAGRQGSCQDLYKRMRMEKVYNHKISDHSPKLIYTPTTGWKAIHTSNNSQGFLYDGSPKFKAQEKLQTLEGMLSFEETYGNAYSQHIIGNNLTLSGFMGCNRNSTPVKLSIKKNNGLSQPSTPDKPSGYSNSQECKNHATMVQLETCEDVNNPMKVKGRRGRKKKEQNSPVNPLPFGMCISVDQSYPRVTTETSIHFQGDDSHSKVKSLCCKDTSHPKAATLSTTSSTPLASYMDSLDDIILKLRWLNISRDHEVSSSQVQNAIVPYLRDGGAMVPYEGTFDLARKRRPRAKVDLDPETNRVWKLLMGKEVEGDEGANVDKEKWWEEERGVFRGRVDSFIARMHLVQGDRRFSQWKGSVVDSVIGVFLTQNVSDHLSSSAFMALAAKFPLRSNGKYRCSNAEKVSMQSLTDLPKLQRNILDRGSCSQNSLAVYAEKNDGKKDNSCSNETLGSGTGSSSVDFCKGNLLELHETEVNFGHESPNSGSGTAATVTSISSVQLEDRRLVDEAISSQNSLVSSQNSVGHQVQSNDYSILNTDAEDLLIGSMNNGFGSSFTELMQMAERNRFQELCSHGSGSIWAVESSSLNSHVTHEIGNSVPALNQLDNSKGTCQPYNADSRLHAQFGLSHMQPDLHFCHSLDLCNSTIMENRANMLKEDSIAYLHPTYEIQSGDKLEITYGDRSESAAENIAEFDSLIKLLSTSRNASSNDSYETIRMQNKEQIIFSNIELGTSQHSFGHVTERKDATLHDDTPYLCSTVQAKDIARFQQKDRHSTFNPESSVDAVRVQHQIENSTKPKISSVSDNKMQNKLDVGVSVGSNKRDEAYNLPKISSEVSVREEKARRRKAWSEKIYDWDSLRKEVHLKKHPEERSSNTMDSLDWEAVRNADVSEISETIRERGMNNMLAERIKDFLNRLVREHGSIDLEWLRDVPSDKSKDYLLSIRGLGLKSAECVRLLTLHHLAFPVDTNVGRICVRLGWVPLQPLPESLQLHLLELYPVLETIQKYLWPRLCKLDQRTLYELHYQMITFGKVFCTKSKPNCNACPMRGECRHFASAFASARLALPAPEDRSIMSSTHPIASEIGNPPVFNQRSIPQLECSSFSQEMTVQKNCEPIIEEPTTPQPECPETLESEIEDAFLEVPDEIPMIKLNFEKFTQNLQIYMQDNMELQGGDLSKALVALNPEAASIPMPKLKNVSRLRTEHQVYEIPDSHPLLELEGLDRREPDDPCPYLLAIWTPGETAQSTEPPEACCNSQDTGQLCNWSSCFACNSIRESHAHKVRGTLLIPCRTAMRGSFPLNGTYFQVNEVFADHNSSCNPIDIPRDWIWNLPRRMVCFGTSIPTIFRGLTTEGIQQCFWKGFVCVRGFDRVTRAPKPLYARLHFPASKAPKNRKGSAAAAAKGGRVGQQ